MVKKDKGSNRKPFMWHAWISNFYFLMLIDFRWKNQNLPFSSWLSTSMYELSIGVKEMEKSKNKEKEVIK